MTNEEMKTGIGTQEAVTLKPMSVLIKEVKIEEVGEKKGKKVIVSCKHPDKEELIKISQVKWENKGKLEVTGLWFNLDSEKKIRKNSSLAVFLKSMSCETLEALVNKTVATIADDKGYLTFKAY